MPDLSTTDFRIQSLGPLDVSVRGGECVALGGPSGAGKSLFLRAIADLDPHEGEARLDGDACSSLPAPKWRRRVGFLPAEPRWWRATVGEHFATVGSRSAGDSGAGDRVAAMPALVERLGFPDDVWTWPVARLSSGETQRLALARLLERGPLALLLDEPTAHLDDEWTRVVETILAEYREQRSVAVLWVTHDAEQAARVAARRLELVEGRLEPADVALEPDGGPGAGRGEPDPDGPIEPSHP